MKKFWRGFALILAFPLVSNGQSATPLTPESLRAALKTKPTGTHAEQLAEQIRQSFGGKEKLQKGPAPKVEAMLAAWAIEVSGNAAVPRIVSDDGRKVFKLTPVGSTGVYAAVITFPYQTVQLFHYEVDGKPIASVPLEIYKPDPESLEKQGVPKGKVTEMPQWRSQIFEGTTRQWWLYVPAQYKPETPACVMVFQDGKGYKDFVPTVFDNLIAKGEIPIMVGIFVSPGVFNDGRSNRSFEYDTLSDQYARFLLTEILPETEKTVKLRHDAASRAIGGISSGGICAFTVAWERPDEFSKVLSWVGSFANIASGVTLREGGHNYPALIRKTPKKAIRVFLQDGENDLDNAHGNWPLANQEMDKALKFAGYDYRFVMGKGYHNNLHGRAILPDSLRWLWRDYKSGISAEAAENPHGK